MKNKSDLDWFFWFTSWILGCFIYFKFSVKQKKQSFMKKLKEIKKMIDSAQKRWAEIKSEENLLPLSNVSIVEKKEKLKNLLEDIRENIESLLSYSHCALLARVCRKFLERIFLISENLGASYAFAGYNESYYILDTIRIAEGFYKKH